MYTLLKCLYEYRHRSDYKGFRRSDGRKQRDRGPGSARPRSAWIVHGPDGIPRKNMTPNTEPDIADFVIPVYTVTGAGSSPLILDDVFEYIFERLSGTGGSVRLANIQTFGG